MKQWTVYFRDKNGSKASVVIEAEDRAGVFAELKKRGISAISVEEGASNKKPRKAPSSGASSKGRGLIAAAMVVLVAGIVAWWMWPEPQKTVAVEKGVKAPEVDAVNPRSVKPEKVRKKVEKPKTVTEAMSNLGEREKPQIKLRELSPEEWLRITNRVFKTGTEQLMSIVFSTEVGDMPMPIPPISEEDRQNIVSILFSKNEIKESDSERVKDCKANVEHAKKEMIEYIKQGGDPDEFLQYYFKELKSAFELRNEAVSQISEVWEENPELAKQFLQKVNEKFTEEGIKLINQEEFE